MGKRVEPAPAPEPAVVNPLAVYRPADLRRLLGFSATTLRRERKRKVGRLRVGRDGRGLFVWGQWLIEWIQSRELVPRPSGEPGPALTNGRAKV